MQPVNGEELKNLKRWRTSPAICCLKAAPNGNLRVSATALR